MIVGGRYGVAEHGCEDDAAVAVQGAKGMLGDTVLFVAKGPKTSRGESSRFAGFSSGNAFVTRILGASGASGLLSFAMAPLLHSPLTPISSGDYSALSPCSIQRSPAAPLSPLSPAGSGACSKAEVWRRQRTMLTSVHHYCETQGAALQTQWEAISKQLSTPHEGAWHS